MQVLVDYGNVSPLIRARGLRYLIDRITSGIAAMIVPTPTELNIRLYSGWDRGHTLTRDAQKLAVDCNSFFPTVVRKESVPVTLKVELVHSLIVLPRKRLSNKLRLEPLRKSVRFKKPSQTTCRNSACPIDNLYDFFASGRCPIDSCAGTVEALADQEQQKLVDSMLVADIIYLASNGTEPIGLVGSDDDMWPGILSALAQGRQFAHLHTKSWTGPSPYFVANLGVYLQKAL